MSIVTLERKTARIQKKAEMVHEESETLNDRIPENDGAGLQSLIPACTSLGHLWRSLIDDICADIDAVELRDLAEPLRQRAQFTVKCCDAVLQVAQNQPALRDVHEVVLMRHEMQNIVSWLTDWPDHDSTNIAASRTSIAAGEFVSDEEFLAMT